MGEECATCGTGDEILFTCRYCERHFCDGHQFPHHACDRFSRTGRSTGAEPDASASSDEVPRGDDGDPATAVTPGTETVTATAASGGTAVPGPSAGGDIVGQHHRPPQTRRHHGPEGATLQVDPSVRPMDSRRAVGALANAEDPRTVEDWLRRQTYLTLVMKVSVIAFLINAAFYGGMAVTLYGLLRIGL